MKDRYDIIVVGAGPAGSLTAKHSALGGADVPLMEKNLPEGTGLPGCAILSTSASALSLMELPPTM